MTRSVFVAIVAGLTLCGFLAAEWVEDLQSAEP
jgi:hypothetical protein